MDGTEMGSTRTGAALGLRPPGPAGVSTARRFLRFCLVGGFCTAANLTFLWITVERWGVNYLAACLLSFLLISLLGYALNRQFTFAPSALQVREEIARYYVVMAISLALNLCAMAMLVEWLALPVLAASLAVSLLLTVGKFLAHAAFTFQSRRGAERNAKERRPVASV